MGNEPMPTIQDISPEQLARLIYHYRQGLLQDGHSRNEDVPSWDRAPQNDRKLMIAAARLALLDLSTPPVSIPGRKYYAQPGEADWGC
jgi:hypothetical protein